MHIILFIEDQNCSKLAKGKTHDIYMSLYESSLTKHCYTHCRMEISLIKLLSAIGMYARSSHASKAIVVVYGMHYDSAYNCQTEFYIT